MSRVSDRNLTPRNGHTLEVLNVCRISGCAKQKELSNEDQNDNARELVQELHNGPTEFKLIATKGKGERLDREELLRIEEAYNSGKYDLVIFDDLSRLIRGGESVRLLGVGVDRGTRSICIADGIDTIDSTWEEDALNACSENVAHNARTSKRVKQKTMNRFKKFGATPKRPIHGYIVPDGATTFDDGQLDEKATAIIQEGARLLRVSLNCSEIADWFNDNQVPVGPCSRRKEWDGARVRNFYANPILKGYPARGTKHTIKIHGTGRRVSVKNPDGPKYYHAPQLAHLDDEEFDSLNELLEQKNSHYKRRSKECRSAIPRTKETNAFPGAVRACWYCGRHFVWGANGITDHLMCTGPRQWNCWNSVGFAGAIAAEQLVKAICGELDKLDGFRNQFAGIVSEIESGQVNLHTGEFERLRRDELALQRETENVKAAIRLQGIVPMLAEMMAEITARERELKKRRHTLEKIRDQCPKVPKSPAVIREALETQFLRLAVDSPEFGSLMAKLVPRFDVYLVRRCDGGHLRPRARVQLDLAGTFPDVSLVAGLSDLVRRDLTIDLWPAPTQVEAIRCDAVRLLEESIQLGHRLSHRAIAE